MKRFKAIFILTIFIFCLSACSASYSSSSDGATRSKAEILRDMKKEIVNGKTIPSIDEKEKIFTDGQLDVLEMRIQPPEGFTRIPVEEGSFADFLRKLPLKPKASKVHYHDGKEKPSEGVYAEVVDLQIADKSLQQLSDAIMELRSRYLWQSGAHDSISFKLANGLEVPYSKWKEGYRVIFEENTANWILATESLDDYDTFEKYLEFIFTYTGTLSLEDHVQSKEFRDMNIGDVLVESDKSKHAVIVADMVENKVTNEKKYLLIQSYKPAQDMQVLINPKDENGGVWYDLKETKEIQTPESVFEAKELKSF